MEEKLHDIEFGYNFLDMTSKAQKTKANIDEWDYIEFRNFSTAKKTVNRVKTQPTRCAKIFANHISGKGLISTIYKEHLYFNKKIFKNQII